ncbi:hypothetical protein CRUP_010498 [Coryphaenoides rupestris]|nr:hypothetical protein CRUP_010498 [Coryphaenoides rupestris]
MDIPDAFVPSASASRTTTTSSSTTTTTTTLAPENRGPSRPVRPPEPEPEPPNPDPKPSASSPPPSSGSPGPRPAMLPWASVAVVVLLQCVASSLGQYEMCKSLVSTDDGSIWEHYACQPKSNSMKDYMRIKVDPPGITCGNPPERFCTLVSNTPDHSYL